MAWLASLRLKKVWFLKTASIQRSTTNTPASTLALSLGFRDPGWDNRQAVMMGHFLIGGI